MTSRDRCFVRPAAAAPLGPPEHRDGLLDGARLLAVHQQPVDVLLERCRRLQLTLGWCRGSGGGSRGRRAPLRLRLHLDARDLGRGPFGSSLFVQNSLFLSQQSGGLLLFLLLLEPLPLGLLLQQKRDDVSSPTLP